MVDVTLPCICVIECVGNGGSVEDVLTGDGAIDDCEGLTGFTTWIMPRSPVPGVMYGHQPGVMKMVT